MSGSGKYIVVFKDHATDEQISKYKESVKDNGGSVTHEYGSVLKGFAAKIPNNYISTLQADSDIIDYIEPDGVVTTQ